MIITLLALKCIFIKGVSPGIGVAARLSLVANVRLNFLTEYLEPCQLVQKCYRIHLAANFAAHPDKKCPISSSFGPVSWHV